MKKLLIFMFAFLLFNNSFAENVKEVIVEEKDKTGKVISSSKKTITKAPKQYKIIETEQVEEIVDKDGKKTTKKIIEREKVSVNNNNINSDSWYDYAENYISIGFLASGSDNYSGSYVSNKINDDVSGLSLTFSKRYGLNISGKNDSWYIEPNIDLQLVNTKEHTLYTSGIIKRSIERDGFVPNFNLSIGYIMNDKYDFFGGLGFGFEDVTYKTTISGVTINYNTSESSSIGYVGIRYKIDKKNTWVEFSIISQYFEEDDVYGYSSSNRDDLKNNRRLAKISFVKRF